MPATVTPPPSESTTARASGDTTSCAALLAAATPWLYLDNPFRRLGLSVLATPREVFRRIDELKLSLELGPTPTTWAFAPKASLTEPGIRAAGQKLKSPRDRFINEFFWFWPESYPAAAPDAALTFLERGETAPALELWLDAALKGSHVARHNLAVYHHLLVLDWERLPEDEETRLDEVWPQALEYWQGLADQTPVWELLRQRVAQLAEPQLPETFVAELRASLPAALAKINAVLLLGDAERGRSDRAALHARLIAMIHRDGIGVRRTLEDSAVPVARRIDTFVREARRAAGDESANALAVGCSLVRHCDDDLRLVETLCGHDDTYTELSHGVADAAVACLVTHQRRTQDDHACLPLLVYLMNMAVTPELRQRLEDTYQVIRDNVVANAVGSATNATGAEHELEHQLIVEKIVPHLDRLQLSAQGQLQFSSRVAAWLAQLAKTAWHELDRPDLASAMLTSALALPCDPAARTPMEQDWDLLEAELLRRRTFHLERNGHTLTIDAREIRFDEVHLPLQEITGLRHGVTASGEFAIAWCSTETVVVLGASNLLRGDDVAADYHAIIGAIDRFLVPELGVRLMEALRSDATVFLGETPLTKAGIDLAPASKPMPGVDTHVPFSRLQVQSDSTILVMSDTENPAITQIHRLSEAWNATIIPAVIEALTHESTPPFPNPC
jgi:hypothetical protein